jgi:hypothetical protein
MARSFNISQSIAAGATVADVIASQGINAYFGKAAAVVIYWNADANGLLASLSSDDGTAAKGLVPAGSAVGVGSTANKIKTQEDFLGQFPIDGGSKLLMSVTNPTGAAITFNAQVVVN